MAEFVTKQEVQRRTMTLIACALISSLALVGIIYSIKAAADLQDKENTQNTIKLLRHEIEQIRSETHRRQEEYREFSRAIGWRTLATSSSDRFATSGVNGDPLRSYLDFWVTELARPGFDVKDFKPWTGPEGTGTHLYLTALYDRLEQLEKDYRNKVQQSETAAQKAESDAKKLAGEIEESEKKNREEIDTKLKPEYKKLLIDLGNTERKNAEELATLEVETYAKQRALTELKNHNRQEESRYLERKSNLETRINWIVFRKEEAKERKEPDGTIFAVDEKDSVAWIDLVHADRIFPGSRFKVYSLKKGGEKSDKGEVEVVLVRERLSSKAAIVKTLDPADPIKAGDKIYNEFYERGKKRYIAIAGRLTGKLSNEEAARKIREFGDEYQERVDERTNYVVVGEGYAGPDGQLGANDADPLGKDDPPNMKLAREWGVKLLLERHLYDYLGVP